MSQLDDRSPTSSDMSDGSPRLEDPGVAQELPSGSTTQSSSGWTWLLVLAAGLAGLGLLPILLRAGKAQIQNYKPPSKESDVWSIAVSSDGTIVAAGAGLWQGSQPVFHAGRQ